MNTKENDEIFLQELKKLSQKPATDNSFNKLKDLTKNKINFDDNLIVKEKTSFENQKKDDYNKQRQEQKEDLNTQQLEKKVEIKEEQFFGTKNEKKESFSWEKNVELPVKQEQFEEYKLVKENTQKAITFNEKLNDFSILKQPKEELEFDWEKRKKIDEPKPEDFELSETKYDWLKNQITPETKINENKKDFYTNKELKNFKWENYEKIDEPLEKDFFEKNQNSEKENELTKTNIAPTKGPKWLRKKENKTTEQKEEPSKPKWLQKKQNTQTQEKQNETTIEKNNETKNPEKLNETKKEEPSKPKWLQKKQNTQTQEKQNETTIEKNNETITQAKQNETIEANNESKQETENSEKIVKPKWLKEKTSQQETIQSTTKINEKKQDAKTKENEINQKKQNETTMETSDNTNIKKAKWGSKNIEEKTPTEKLEVMKTTIDEMFEILETNKNVLLETIAKRTGTDYYKLEQIAKMFEDYGIIELKYSTSLNAKAKITLKKEVISRIKNIPEGEILSEYKIEIDSVPAIIKVISKRDESRPIYSIIMPSIGKYTKKFLDFIKTEIAESMPIELDEILDPKKSKRLKERFFEESQKQLTKYFPNSPKKVLDILSGTILHEMYGLGEIEVILGDDMLEEVAINSSKTPIAIYHRIHGWMTTNLYPGTEEEIMNYASQIGRKIGREITVLSPILDAHLLSGDRVNATLFPISAEGNTLTIRRFARKPWTLVDFIGKAHTMSSEMAALLWLAMQYEMNVIIAGGTASGKTSALNTLLALVPSYHRIISIEDVREIILPIYLTWNWIPMITRSANPEGLGEVTMLDCMVSSLRMRPDRIIVGEIRRKREAEVMMEAIETGHSIYSTIHANSAYQVLRRLAEPPMAIPIMQIELIDLIVVQFRDRKTNKRRTYEISEIEQTSAGKGLQINTIYKWLPRTDSWEQLNKPTKLLTTLNQHTGLTEDEIEKELSERTKILDWLQKQEINDLNQIGFIVKLFYSNSERVKKMANDNTTKEQIEEMMK